MACPLLADVQVDSITDLKPEWFREKHRERCLRLPMRPEARSLNLANSVAVFTYEALRQLDFLQLQGEGEMGQTPPTLLQNGN